MPRPLNGAKRSSKAKRNAAPATWMARKPNRDGTCIPHLKCALTIFRRAARPTIAIAPHHLNGLWTHTKGGFYHDGRFPTLLDVVNHYDDCKSLGLTSAEKNDLVEFLKSIPETHTGDRDRDGDDRD